MVRHERAIRSAVTLRMRLKETTLRSGAPRFATCASTSSRVIRPPAPVPRIAGVESYYLNFTESKEALELAARENATSQKSVFDLHDIIQKITLHDKAEESKDFAGKIQTSLYSFSARNFPAEKNRGVKKAPFVVLIGANMPSVLAEMGFVTNVQEAKLLKAGAYRQKIAESLFSAIQKYQRSLKGSATVALQ